MSTVGFIERSLAFTHAALKDARNGTDEQLHFVPESGSHSIAWCLWHTSRVEDLIMSRITGREPVWSEDWAAKTGLPFDGFGTNMSDDDAQQIHVTDVSALAGYQDAVFRADGGVPGQCLGCGPRARDSGSERDRERRRGDLAAHVWVTSTGTAARSTRCAGCRVCRP